MSYIAGVMFLLLLIVGGAGAWYYNDTQARMTVLRENNAKLEVAIETSEQSIKTLQSDMEKQAELNLKLQQDLQKAEAYGDDLRSKLRQHDLTALAIKKPGQLEGKMNGATAKLWRNLVEDSGGKPDNGLPKWLQSEPVQQSTGAGSQSSNENRESNSTDPSETETGPAS